MTIWQALLLVGGGALAGVINSMAGGGSILTVPLLVLAGVGGNAANGSNRVGVLTSSLSSVLSFHRRGVTAYRQASVVVAPMMVGSLVGAYGVGRLADDQFEKVFGLLILPIIFLSIRPPRVVEDGPRWGRATMLVVFFGMGLYAGAVQAGVGLLLLAGLTRSGYDLVTANVIKLVVIVPVTLVALPVFIAEGNVRWGPAAVLAAGVAAGGWVGARIAVEGGERVIRWVMVLASLALAGRLFGLYG